MWAELLPTLIGSTIVDHDAPSEPAIITGFKLTDTHVYIVAGTWEFGGQRQYMHVGPGPRPGTFYVGGFGIAATIITTPETEAVL